MRCDRDSSARGGLRYRLILASASPRRRMLMSQVGLEFEVLPADVDEDRHVATAGDSALIGRQVEVLAEAKARAAAAGLGAAATRDCQALVIGADTVVLIDGEVLVKPLTADAAQAMLRKLSGRTHEVLTGVAVLDAATGHVVTGVEQTRVTFVPLVDDWIAKYVSTGEPMDKAGAYAVQGLGSVFIERVEGCYFNVVGLPLALLARLLRQQGYEVIKAW